MSPTDLLGGPLAQAVGMALLHALWQGAIVAGVLATALALLTRRTAQTRYAVSCAALAIVFGLTVVTATRSYTPRPTAQPVAPQAVTAMAVPEDAILIVAPEPLTWQDRWTSAVAAMRAHIPQIVIVWLIGVLVLSIRLAVSWSRARSLATRASVAADDHWQRIASRLATALGLRRAIRLAVSGRVEVPSVIGWIEPAILLPVSSFTGLTPEQLEMVLAHELAHIRRHDFLVNAVQSVVETLLFYNPAVWYMSRQIRIERENCCDDLAVSVCGNAIEYARALAQLEELRAPALAVAATDGSLITRVRRLVGGGSDRSLFSSSGWTAVAAMTSFVLLLAVATAPLMAEKRAAEAPLPSGTQIDVTAPQTAPAPTPEKAAAAAAKDIDHDIDINIDPDMDINIDPDIDVDVQAVVPAMPVPAIAPVATTRPMRIAAALANGIATGIAGGIEGGIEGGVATIDEDESSPTPPGKLSVDELIALRVQNITPEYVQQMRAIGLGELSLRDIISFKVQGITPEYVQQMRATGFPDLKARDIIGFKVQDVTPEYVQKMRATGLPELSARDIMSLKVQDVTPEYISSMRSAGVTIKSAREVIGLKVQNVTPDFVRQLAAAGYEHMTARDLMRLAAAGVNADFIRDMSKYKSKENKQK